MDTVTHASIATVKSAIFKRLRVFLIVAIPASLAACASTQTADLIDFDPEQAYAFSGTIRGQDLEGVVQFTDDGYRIYSTTAKCNGEPRRLQGRDKSSRTLDLRCGSLALRFWLVDGQIQTEGTATLTTEVQLAGNAPSLNRTERTVYTGRVTIGLR